MNEVLIVDDDPSIRKLFHTVLNRENIDVLEACDGTECLQLLENFEPSVILMDMQLPNKSGISTIKEIRAKNKQIIIIAMSGRLVFDELGSIEDVENVMDLAIDAFLLKPITRNELLSTLKSFMVY